MTKRTAALTAIIAAGAIALGGCARTGAVKSDAGPAPAQAMAGANAKTADNGSAPSPAALPNQSVSAETVRPATGTAENASRKEAVLDTVLFGFDSYLLDQPARKTLQENARYLKDHPDARVRIEGNTDERGSEEYNLALGDKRARAAQAYLVTLGIPSSRLSTVSYGKEKPVDQRHEETAWLRNRRDDFVIAR